MNKKLKKGLDITAIVLVVIIFLLGAAVLTLTVTRNRDGVPSLFGVTFLNIQSDSMKGTVNRGDVAVITKVDKVTSLKKGDIITFWDTIEGKKQLNTHRIVSVTPNPNNPAESIIVTRGDNAADNDPYNKTFNQVVGLYRFRMPGLGYFIDFLQSPLGFALLIILPLSAFLIYRVYKLVRVILEMKKEKDAEKNGDPEAMKKELEELRAKVASLEDSAGGGSRGEK